MCKQVDTVCNIKRIRKTITYVEQVSLYYRQSHIWDKVRTKYGDNYKSDSYGYWADEQNFGISHYGINPYHPCRDCIKLNVFYLRISITRLILKFIQHFIISQPVQYTEYFSQILANAQGIFSIPLWNCNKEISALTGRDIQNFIEPIP